MGKRKGIMIQLDFFEKDEVSILKEELKKVHERSEKVRRGMFARHNELAKMYIELNERMHVIEKNICTSVR